MTFSVLDLALEFLRVDPTGDQRFVWGATAEKGLALLLDALFIYPTDHRSEVETLLRLVCALDVELRSPATAARLRTILKADARVTALCDVTARSTELRAAQVRWTGTEEAKRAPVHGGRAPLGTITAASLFDPGSGAARGAPVIRHRAKR